MELETFCLFWFGDLFLLSERDLHIAQIRGFSVMAPFGPRRFSCPVRCKVDGRTPGPPTTCLWHLQDFLPSGGTGECFFDM